MTTLGLYCRLHDDEGETIGYAHLPPVAIGDLVALERGEYRVVNVIVSPAGYPIEALVQVRPVLLSVVS